MLDRINMKLAAGPDVALPRMARVRQSFGTDRLHDIAGTVAAEFDRPGVGSSIEPGQTIAIGAGSRGVAQIFDIIKAVVDQVKARGAEPFVFPAMGSHGGATAEGQREVLESYGITEETIGAPVRSSMETVIVGELDGQPVHMDAHAHAADGVILVNRIKPHTNFRGDIESGVVKMMTIGMGKISGAIVLHSNGMDCFDTLLPATARFLMERIPFLFGVGVVENAYDEPAHIETLPAASILEREADLQAMSKKLMGRLYFDDIDVLVLDQMGKEISGSGFDPNITGRNNRFVDGFDHPRVRKIVVLDLSEKTHGNATGLGLADVITARLFQRIDFDYTYANVITAGYLDGASIPVVMPTMRAAIQLAARTVPRVKSEEARIVRIRDTLTLGEIQVSEPLLAEVEAHPNMEVLRGAEPFVFDEGGSLAA